MLGARFISNSPTVGDIEVTLVDRPLTLGRSVLSDVSIPDVLISRRHCELKVVDGKLVVHDLESTNGTIVNGEVVEDCVLNEGDVLVLGQSEFTTKTLQTLK